MRLLLELVVWKITLIVMCSSQENYDILPSFLRFTPRQYQNIKDIFLNVVGKTASNSELLEKARKINRLQPVLNKFPCNTTGFRSPVTPKNVHQLRPGDIDVIGALGDSLTAANGAAASNVFHIYTENRGISWSIGGQGSWKEFLTLPNIIKEFNPSLVGYSLGDSFTHHRTSQFNPGEVGAMSRDIPYMATVLVKRIKNDKRVNFKEDWKLITLLIGSNDFCVDICYKKNVFVAPELHRRDLIKTIEYLKENLPRTILQIVISPNLELIVNFRGLPTICKITQTSECPCLIGLPFSHKRKDMFKVMSEWQRVEMEVASDMKYTTNDFAVVYQPFTMQLKFPSTKNRNGDTVTDITYLSQDCFHFSQKGYSRAANALWNNLLEPTGNKSMNWEKEFSRFRCPTEKNPYIFTNKNSLGIR